MNLGAVNGSPRDLRCAARMVNWFNGEKAEDRRQETEDGRQRAEDRPQGPLAGREKV